MLGYRRGVRRKKKKKAKKEKIILASRSNQNLRNEKKEKEKTPVTIGQLTPSLRVTEEVPGGSEFLWYCVKAGPTLAVRHRGVVETSYSWGGGVKLENLWNKKKKPKINSGWQHTRVGGVNQTPNGSSKIKKTTVLPRLFLASLIILLGTIQPSGNAKCLLINRRMGVKLSFSAYHMCSWEEVNRSQAINEAAVPSPRFLRLYLA